MNIPQTTPQFIVDARRRIEQKLVTGVERQLGCSVTIIRWDRNEKYGWEKPVFRVPESRQNEARDLGLTVE